VKPPRGLSAAEAALWRKVTATVVPLIPPRHGEGDQPKAGGGGSPPNTARAESPHHRTASGPPPRAGEELGRTKPLSPDRGLDASWERKLARAAIEPDFTLDLHGHTLDQAHRRLDAGLAQAKAMGARLVLLITGNPRPVDAADRATRRGAIRAKVLDWLAAGPHGADVAAVRPAHRRHGGAGALYLVLRRKR
jgi:DNA-nicking Smr family endonuclease